MSSQHPGFADPVLLLGTDMWIVVEKADAKLAVQGLVSPRIVDGEITWCATERTTHEDWAIENVDSYNQRVLQLDDTVIFHSLHCDACFDQYVAPELWLMYYEACMHMCAYFESRIRIDQNDFRTWARATYYRDCLNPPLIMDDSTFCGHVVWEDKR